MYSQPAIPEIDASELQKQLQASSPPMLLDVREAEERAAGSIPNSLHIPMNWVPYQLVQLNKDRPIVVYCAHGIRSGNVAVFLNRQGFQARSLRGGIYGWLAAHGVMHYGR